MNSISRCKPLLGTYVELTLSSEKESEDTLIDMSIAAYAEIENIETLMSFHNHDSELSYVNEYAHLKPCELSQELEEVLLQALEISKRTNGLFDISIASELVRRKMLPEHKTEADNLANWQDIKLENGLVSFDRPLLVDLGGIAKGYAVDKALSVVCKEVDMIINAGGDMRMSSWKGQTVCIRHPKLSKNSTVELPMQEASVATSASYYLDGDNVIIDPLTKESAQDYRSFSVFAPNCMLADALTKVAVLSGGDDRLIKSLSGKMVIIDYEEAISIH